MGRCRSDVVESHTQLENEKMHPLHALSDTLTSSVFVNTADTVTR